jgi:hypothetical protein
MRRFVMSAASAALLATTLFASSASAGGPTFERFDVAETFYDEFLSAECGVDVWTTATGHVTRRTFDDRATGAQSVNSLNIELVARAGDNTFNFRDVGADVVQAGPDGSLTLLIIGQVPFEFSGVLKIDLLTEEIILEPSHLIDTSRACAALTA